MKRKIYLKDYSFDPLYSDGQDVVFLKQRLIPTSLILTGIFVFISQVVLPLAAIKTTETTDSQIQNKPVAKAIGFTNFKFGELENFTEANALGIATDANIPEYFYLTIPKLKIYSAKVETNSTNLNPEKSLGHYNRTALPGSVGTSFIYGHSVLPWFYNPKNYKTIFSKLGDLKEGDTFIINYNNRGYVYKVDGRIEAKPKDIDPLMELTPKYLNESNVILMTCWPAGTKINRLLITATLEN